MSTPVDKNGKELGLRDVIVMNDWDQNYSTMTITHVFPDGTVDTLRPYVATEDFSCPARDNGSRVIAYLGYEEVKGINPKNCTLVCKGIPPR